MLHFEWPMVEFLNIFDWSSQWDFIHEIMAKVMAIHVREVNINMIDSTREYKDLVTLMTDRTRFGDCSGNFSSNFSHDLIRKLQSEGN